jgi:hypothetical protein
MNELLTKMFGGSEGVQSITTALGISVLTFVVVSAVIALISLVLKGFALWYSARNYQKNWFVVMVVLNTFGILEVIYLIWFRADKDTTITPSLFTPPVVEGDAEQDEKPKTL